MKEIIIINCGEVKKDGNDAKVVITANGFNSNVIQNNNQTQVKVATPNKVVPVATQPNIKPIAPIAPVAKATPQPATPTTTNKLAINSVLPITPNKVVPYTVPKNPVTQNAPTNNQVSPIPKLNIETKK